MTQVSRCLRENIHIGDVNVAIQPEIWSFKCYAGNNIFATFANNNAISDRFLQKYTKTIWFPIRIVVFKFVWIVTENVPFHKEVVCLFCPCFSQKNDVVSFEKSPKDIISKLAFSQTMDIPCTANDRVFLCLLYPATTQLLYGIRW